jgi:hypothetical protein
VPDARREDQRRDRNEGSLYQAEKLPPPRLGQLNGVEIREVFIGLLQLLSPSSWRRILPPRFTPVLCHARRSRQRHYHVAARWEWMRWQKRYKIWLCSDYAIPYIFIASSSIPSSTRVEYVETLMFCLQSK